MKVGVLVHSLAGGGGEATARSWARELAARGHEMTILLYGPEAETDADLSSATCIFQGGMVDRWLRLPGWVRRVAAERGLDVLLSVLDFSNVTALRALARHGTRDVPVVIAEQTVPTLHWRYDGLSGRVKKRMARALYRRADGVIVLSHAVGADLRIGYGVPPERLFVLPNPVPAVDEPPSALRGATGDLRRIVVVGRLVGVKRIDRLFEVLIELAARGHECTAAVIGDGPDCARLETEAERLRLPVEFLGWSRCWQEHIRAGDCLLLPSDVEGFGNVLVEAAAAGVPAVAPSTALGVGDALIPGLTGVLAPSPSAGDLADAVLEAAARGVRPELVRPWLCTFSPALLGRRVEEVLLRVRQRLPPAERPSVGEAASSPGTARDTEPGTARRRPVVTHVGPGPEGQGGIAAVLRAYQAMPSDRRERRFITSFSVGSPLWSLVPFLRAAARLLLEDAGRLGIVHAHLSFRGSFVREGTLMALARVRRLPVVATLHGSDFPEFLEGHPRLVRWVLGTADSLVVLSEEIPRLLPAELAARAVLVPNPVAVPDAQPEPAGDRPPVAVFAGEIDLRKGVDVLLQAWPRVRERVLDGRLLIAGAPGMHEPVAPAGIPGVEWLGAVGHDEVDRLLRAARLAVLPSRRDAMPVFVLEAMALGRPVVATKVGAVAETVGGGGIVVPPEDPEALAAAMLVLLTDAGTATRLGKDGRERVASLFGLDAVAVRLDAVYEEVAHARHGPSAARLRSASSGRAREGRTRWPVSAGDRAHD